MGSDEAYISWEDIERIANGEPYLYKRGPQPKLRDFFVSYEIVKDCISFPTVAEVIVQSLPAVDVLQAESFHFPDGAVQIIMESEFTEADLIDEKPSVELSSK